MLSVKRNGFLLMPMVLSLLLTACQGGDVQVKPVRDFPTPLVEPLPTRLGVYYPPEFRNFVYEEAKDEQGAGEKAIDMGAAQLDMFNKLLGSFFIKAEEVPGEVPASMPPGLDTLLIPEIVDFEFSIPRLSKANIYEVWIKYRFRLLDRDGTLIADWTMPAYGKTPTAFLTSAQEALNLASIMALRDCGAGFITGFTRVPEITAWLDNTTTRQPEEADDQ
jgi:hypothetical protein